MYTIKDILKIEVAPALGCTEPAAIALCTAAAGSLLSSKELVLMELWLSSNIYKNAFAVAIPGTKGAVGIELVAAMGFFGGNPELRLEVLETMNEKTMELARQFVKTGKVKIHLLKEKKGIYIRARLTCADDVVESQIEETHDNLTGLKFNGEVVVDHKLLSEFSQSKNNVTEVEKYLGNKTLEELLVLTEDMDDDDYEFLRQGVKYNLELAQHGLVLGNGLGVGKTLDRLCREGLIKEDMIHAARTLTSAACDARMAGVKLPAMSSAGSGNHGLTAILPIWAVKDYINEIEEIDVLKAIALSHVITGYIKAHTGRLSAVCGCSIAAGAGAAGGVAYLMGGNLNHIAGAIKNLISDLAGVICDGAKASCALKLATAAGTAVQSALFSLHGINVKESDGIIAFSPEETMRNMGELSAEGMIETDQTILRIMIDKQFKNLKVTD